MQGPEGGSLRGLGVSRAVSTMDAVQTLRAVGYTDVFALSALAEVTNRTVVLLVYGKLESQIVELSTEKHA